MRCIPISDLQIQFLLIRFNSYSFDRRSAHTVLLSLKLKLVHFRSQGCILS